MGGAAVAATAFPRADQLAYLHTDVHGRRIESLKEHLGALFTIARRVKRGFGEKYLRLVHHGLECIASATITRPLTGCSFTLAPSPSKTNDQTRCMSSQS